MSDQIDVNQLSNALQQKVDLPSGKSQVDIDYVVEWQKPTSANNYTWYRLYRSGWIEQGGPAPQGIVYLPKTMLNANYVVLTECNGSGSNPGTHVTNRTTESFEMGNTSGWSMTWVVKGMAAQS